MSSCPCLRRKPKQVRSPTPTPGWIQGRYLLATLTVNEIIDESKRTRDGGDGGGGNTPARHRRRELLHLKLDKSSYVLDIYGFSIVVQNYGAVWRYTFIIPHIQEQKMGHVSNSDRIAYFEEATFEINHIDGIIKLTGPAKKDPLEEIKIPNCYVWLSVQVKRKYSDMNELYGLLKEAEKSYQSIISQLQSSKKTLSMLDIVRFEYAIVSKVVGRLTSNGVSYGRSVKSAMEDRRSMSLQESVFIQLNGDSLYTRI